MNKNEIYEAAQKALERYKKYRNDEEFVEAIVETFKTWHNPSHNIWFEVFKDEPIMIKKFEKINNQMLTKFK